jgi:hypothetical protein
MRNWIKNGGRVALLAAGIAAVGSGVAHADTTGRESQTLAAHHARAVHARVSANIGDCGSLGVCDSGLLGLGVRAHVRLHLGLGLGLGGLTGLCGSSTGYVPVAAANCCDTPGSLLLP